MKNKLIYIFGLSIIILFALSVLAFNYSFGADGVNGNKEKIRIAVCSSCKKIADRLDPNRYEVIYTQSTSQSVTFLQAGIVEMILSGRTLKPTEPSLYQLVLGEGYSFLSTEEFTVFENSLNEYSFFTDLDVEKIKSLFALRNITQVDDVYEYLGQGIVITSWENTDYSKGRVVHVLQNDGQRFALSRRPTLYCPMECGNEIKKDILSIIKNI